MLHPTLKSHCLQYNTYTLLATQGHLYHSFLGLYWYLLFSPLIPCTPATLKVLKSPAFLIYFCSRCSSLCLFTPCSAWLMPIYLLQVSTGSPETALKSGSLVLCCCSPRNMKNLPVTQPSGLQGASH